MNIGRRVDYAIRALSYLAAQPTDMIVSRREIQTKQDIPAHFLSKIMKRLASGGLVKSYMGTRGGFALKKAAAEIARVLEPGGRISIAAWTPEGAMGKFFATSASHMPSPPEGFSPASSTLP